MSSKLVEGTNTITFHPNNALLDEATYSNSYNFNPLTVVATGSVDVYDYEVTISDPSSAVVEYTKGNGTVKIFVATTYDYTTMKALDDTKFYAYINGNSTGILVKNTYNYDVRGSALTFAFYLTQFDEYLTESTNTIVLHPDESYYPLAGISTYNYQPLTVNIADVPTEIKYETTPEVDTIEYAKGENKEVAINIDCDNLDYYFEYCILYAYINGSTQGIRLNGVMADTTPTIVDLKLLNDYFEVGETYSIVFHPQDDDFGQWGGPTLSEAKFNPLTVTVKEGSTEPAEPVYTITPTPDTVSDYVLGSDLIINVVADYDSAKAYLFENRAMFIYINGEEIVIPEIKAYNTSFSINLINYTEKLVEGVNNISIHPQLLALQTVFQTVDDVFVFNNLTVNAEVPKLTEVNLVADDLVMGYKDGSAWTVTLTDAEGNAISDAIVGVGINGRVYNVKTDANGGAGLTINLAPGTYDINATFDETSVYESAFVNATITVGAAEAVLAADNLVMNYKDGSGWEVTLTNVNGNVISDVNVVFGIKGATYTVKTDANGTAKLPINLAVGTYDINASFAGNKYYSEAFVNATVTVEKAVATLTASDLEMTYKDGSAWAVTLTDANGNVLSGVSIAFGIKGTTYNIKTDDNGIAKLPINLAIGEYPITATLNNPYYEAEAIENTVTVKDMEADIVASDVNMTYKDGTAYEVQLVDSEGNNVAISNIVVKITIKGSTYNVKTDANGIAKLPINLYVGTYDISAEYNGKVINNTIVVNKA